MTPVVEQLDFSFEGCVLEISARRIFEHTQLRQINPFEIITPSSYLKPQEYVDIIDAAVPVKTLTGLTLSDLLLGKHSGLSQAHVKQLQEHIKSTTVQQWLVGVGGLIQQFSEHRIVRNLPKLFLPIDTTSPLGVQGLHCALASWLEAHKSERASTKQWFHRINNLTKKGLRAEEMEFSFKEELLGQEASKVAGGDIATTYLTYKALRLSIIPVTHKVGSHLTFSKVSANVTIKRIKPKLKAGLVTHPQWRDRVLGYWVDVVNWDDLLGQQRGWMAFTHRGQPIVSDSKPTGLCTTYREAWSLANDHAREVYPKLTTKGRWSHFRLTGGEQYHEWLVTLPYYGPSYFSDHFFQRNVLLHVQCDMREGADGERILALQEVQSDWAQQARRILKEDSSSLRTIPAPPWQKEWPALALKLMLLHAAQRGATALVWTQGHVQVSRYDGLGKTGLLKLYDHTLPAEMTRILRPYGKKCGIIDVYQPVNFYIDPADIGYEVRDEYHNLLGTAATWKMAKALLPDGAHESLKPMHGIRLDETLRQKLLKDGFYAWGAGIL